MNLLISNGEVTMADIDAVYHRKLSASKELLFEACKGKVTEHHKCMLQMIRMGGDKDKGHILRREVSKTGSPQGKDLGIGCSRTFDPESCIAYPAQ